MGSQTSTRKINIEQLDTSVTDWAKATGFIHKDRTRNFKVFQSIKENETCICNNNWGKQVDDCEEIVVEKRIGSQSMAGEAYLIDIRGEKAVVKLMPIISEKSEAENKNELRIAIQASNLVVRGQSQFFPLVYAVSECNNTIFNPKSSFYKKANLYAMREHIGKQIDGRVPKKRFMALSRTKESLKEIMKVSMNPRSGGLKEPPNTEYTVRSHVMIDELAWGDLGQYILENKNKMTLSMWDLIFLQVFMGINYMQEKLSVVHRDLHQGNVLLSFHENKNIQFVTCLIHDFGKSDIIEAGKWRRLDRIADVEIFFNAMEKHAPPPIMEKIEYVKKNIIDAYPDGGAPIMPTIMSYWGKV